MSTPACRRFIAQVCLNTWGELLGSQRRAVFRRSESVLVEQPFDGVSAERYVAAAREQRVGGSAGPRVQPGAQHGDGLSRERGGPIFAPFAVAANMGTAAHMEITAGEPCQL